MPNPSSSITLAQLNRLTQADFVAQFGDIYEHSAWAAESTFAYSPFASLQALKDAFRYTVDHASESQKLALLKAHPELGEQKLDSLTPASLSEQTRAGLTQVDDTTKTAFRTLNKAYRERHGFPFIIAVAGLDATAILNALKTRQQEETPREFQTALQQVHRIAEIRLGHYILDK